MANPRTSPKELPRPGATEVMMTSVGALGRGIHAATIELQDGDTYRVKLLSGERCTATAAPDVSPKLLGECLSARRTVMLADSEHGPVILGALQTAPTPYVDPKTGAFDVAAEHIRLRADATISLQVGPTSLALEKSGVARIEGEQVVIDAAALARVLATKLELP